MLNVRSSDNHSAVAAFASGELRVSHTFPKGINAKIEVTVNLEKKELAKKLASATFMHKGGKKKLGVESASGG